MIHYTLLPEKEIKRLKREYRVRLFIFILFFMSCAVLLGIISLAPAYIYSFSQEKSSLDRLADLQKSREQKGTDTAIKELAQSNTLIHRIKTHQNPVVFSKVILQILSHRVSGLTMSSFGISATDQTIASSSIQIIVQGKAATREALIRFKDSLSADPFISSVDLPIEDLAKSKDISYAIKIMIIAITPK